MNKKEGYEGMGLYSGNHPLEVRFKFFSYYVISYHFFKILKVVHLTITSTRTCTKVDIHQKHPP